MSFFKTLTKIEKQGNRRRAVILLNSKLRELPDDPWLLNALAMNYYELRQYKRALRIARKGLSMNPMSSVFLWDVACCLDMLDREREAIVLWKRLMRRKPERVREDGADSDAKWGPELLNDSRYRVGVSYLRIGMRKTARKYPLQHIQGRGRGLRSIFHKSKALRRLRETE